MRHDPGLTAAITLGLGAGIGKVQVLDSFHFNMNPLQIVTNHVWRIRIAGELLSASGHESILPEQRSKLKLPNLAFAFGIQNELTIGLWVPDNNTVLPLLPATACFAVHVFHCSRVE